MKFLLLIFLFVGCLKTTELTQESYIPPKFIMEMGNEVPIFPTKSRKITSKYGMRNGKLHKGVDIGVPLGTEVFNILPGVVVGIGQGGTYGKYIIIQHLHYKTVYAHLSKHLVKIGDFILSGTSVGLSGNTGHSTGPHLHFEIKKNDRFIDPMSIKYKE